MRTQRQDRPGKRTDRQRNGDGRDRRGQPAPSEEWLYGRNGVGEALKAGRRRFHRLLVLDSAGGDPRLNDIDRRARDLGVRIERVDRDTLNRVVPDVNHQGVAALASPYPYAPVDSVEHATTSILALDHLVDPQNVGTLLRTAEALGIRTVLLPRDRAAGITPAVVNSSAGAVEHLSIVQTVNLAQELERLKKRDYWIVGIEHHERASILGKTAIPTPCVLVIGSEGQGMGPNLAKRCDLLLKIEMQGKVNSLNAATAGAIALFELNRN
ncbi:MAG: 23S rRNA (guanosine(2251)-2'-O)-methyltransferase RlmB [Thermomicrobiales bacterium]|nr:23S rRNA (guanosine(2251)-2'-O)-methyltransferase RlmB [Thermomicrobiales bacterium]MCO5223445.1 23S rRNA (guanosine(2251)-2'-O)-methyltransferase RlmB [Thermomicrobiales bacterium]